MEQRCTRPPLLGTSTVIVCTSGAFRDKYSSFLDTYSILRDEDRGILSSFQAALNDERIISMQTIFPIYYAGFEVGSGFSGLKLIPADGLTLAQDLATLPSFLADGDIGSLLKGSDLEAKLADVLQHEEYV